MWRIGRRIPEKSFIVIIICFYFVINRDMIISVLKIIYLGSLVYQIKKCFLACNYQPFIIWLALTCLPGSLPARPAPTPAPVLHYLLPHWPSHFLLDKSCHCPSLDTSLLTGFPLFPLSSSVSFCLNPNYYLRHLAWNLPWFFPKEIILPPLIVRLWFLIIAPWKLSWHIFCWQTLCSCQSVQWAIFCLRHDLPCLSLHPQMHNKHVCLSFASTDVEYFWFRRWQFKLEEQEAMVTIMALICHAVIVACGKILSTHGDINVSKTLKDRMGHMCVCV